MRTPAGTAGWRAAIGRGALVAVLAALLAGCPGEPPAEEAPPQTVVVNPAAVEAGDTVGRFEIVQIDARRANGAVWYGEAEFAGTVDLIGGYFDFEPEGPDGEMKPCLRTKPESVHQLPRFPGDQRTPWFCFTNPEEVIEALGPPPRERRRVRIVIDQYHYIHEPTDVINWARFVGVSQAVAAARPATRAAGLP